MTLPGYDPGDLDTELEAELSEGDLDQYLDADERARYEDGESIVDLLSSAEISEILGLDT
jgi:biopolymer transport protein ExbD